MAAHVVCGDLVRDPLKAEIEYQPVEQRGAVMPVNRGTQSLVTKLFEQVERASETADLVNKANGVINRSGVEMMCFVVDRASALTCGAAGDHRNSNQRDQLALGVGVAVDIPLSGLD